MTKRVWYTADVIVPDGTDTWVYGESTLEGCGATLESGWISPDYADYVVFEGRSDVAPDTYDSDDEERPAAWLAKTVASRLGACEADSSAGTPRWFCAVDAIDHGLHANISSDASVIMHAHPEGFTEREIYVASRILRIHGYLLSWGG